MSSPGVHPALPPGLDPRGGRPAAAPGARPVRTGRRPPTRIGRLARRTLVVLAAIAALAVLASSASGWALLSWSTDRIARVDAFKGLTNRPPAGAAGSTTFLLVGSDGRTGMSRAEMRQLHVGTAATAAGRRADTMLLVHISAQHGTVDVVSLPRDSYVTIPAHRATDGAQVPERKNKLNAAYAFGGPSLTVATIERTTGVRIDHYLEVDFMGFVRLVDAVGGVDVCSPTPMRDRKAGLHLPAGVTHVDGRTGLAYVRARHLDATADLGRVQRQQRFLAAMVDRATSKDVLLDPRALVRFLNAALAAVRADPGLTEGALVRLGTEMRHVSGGDIRFRTVPIANPSYRTARAGSVALWDAGAAAQVFTAMREDKARPHHAGGGLQRPTVPADQVHVRVYNAAGTAGLGSRATADLAAAGFVTDGPALNWRHSGLSTTTVRYDARYSESIKTVAAALPGARLVPVTGLGRTMQVVVGSSYAGARTVTVSAPSSGATTVRTAGDQVCS
ncbi:MAG TPA: LCP family protein [Actinomycetes bacterium]|jgi:LCP family protein required for cell wall assembly|nr:LCP family protein [Actinomycetes bacterium]